MSVAARRVAALETEIRTHRDRQQVLMWHRSLARFLPSHFLFAAEPRCRFELEAGCTHPDALWLWGFTERLWGSGLAVLVQALEQEEPTGLTCWLMFRVLRSRDERTRGALVLAAEAYDFPLAQGDLALELFHKREYELAAQWACRGAGHGELNSAPAALYVLACLHLQGKGGFAIDTNEGFAYLRRAAMLNSAVAQHTYARLCCPEDQPEHFYWLGRAAGLGFSDGRALLNALQVFLERYAADWRGSGPLIFQIGASLRPNLNGVVLFGKGRVDRDPHLLAARQAMAMHEQWCRKTLDAVNAFLIVARQLNCRGEAGFMCFPRDVRGIVASLIWETRRDALYLLQ